MLCYSQDGLHASLTSLPSEALQTEALKLFKVKWRRARPHQLVVGALAMCPGSAHAVLPTMMILGWRRPEQAGGSPQKALKRKGRSPPCPVEVDREAGHPVVNSKPGQACVVSGPERFYFRMFFVPVLNILF